VTSVRDALPPARALLTSLPHSWSPEFVTLLGACALAATAGLDVARHKQRVQTLSASDAASAAASSTQSSQQAQLVAAAAEEVAHLERRIRNVQSALGATPQDWHLQRSPLESTLRELNAQLGDAQARLQDVKAGRAVHKPTPQRQKGTLGGRRRRPWFVMLFRAVRAWFARHAFRRRARDIEDRLDALADALQAVQTKQLSSGSNSSYSNGARSRVSGATLVGGDVAPLAVGRPWAAGDAAIAAQLSRLEGAIKQRWESGGATDAAPAPHAATSNGSHPTDADLSPEAGALATLEARVEYLSAVLSQQPYSGTEVAARLAAVETANETHADAAATLAIQLEETAAATRSAIEALTLRLAATEALAAALQQSVAAPGRALPPATAPEVATPWQQTDKSISRVDVGRDIILQGFNWTSHHHHGGNSLYKRLRDRVADIASVGFTAVWLPPSSQSLSREGYMPQDYWNLNTAYGTEQQLRDLLTDMREAGLLPMADVVLNHRCATRRGRDGKWNRWDGVARAAWDESAITRNNAEWSGTGAYGTGEEWVGAPNVDHTSNRVREDLKQFLVWLRNDIGFSGLRLDFVKGYAPRYAQEYSVAFGAELAVGEMWQNLAYRDGELEWNQDGHRQSIVNWVDSTQGACTAFDFTTKGILQQACATRQWWRLRDAAGRPPGVMGLWPSRAVTFLDNHDTGSHPNQGHWPFPSNRVAQGYAYILSHPGTPCVLWDHAFEWGDDVRGTVRQVCAARRSAGITSRSSVEIHKADDECYAAVITGTVGAVAVRLGGGSWSPPGGNWAHVTSGGHDGGHHCVWMKNA
jgi:alpha-amylase